MANARVASLGLSRLNQNWQVVPWLSVSARKTWTLRPFFPQCVQAHEPFNGSYFFTSSRGWKVVFHVTSPSPSPLPPSTLPPPSYPPVTPYLPSDRKEHVIHATLIHHPLKIKYYFCCYYLIYYSVGPVNTKSKIRPFSLSVKCKRPRYVSITSTCNNHQESWKTPYVKDLQRGSEHRILVTDA